MFEIINETNEEIKEIKDVEGFLTFAIKKLKLKNVVFDIIITNNEEVRKLNREYSGIDNYTDVISFALEDYEDIKTDVRLLGDIYISLDKIKEQSKNYGHSFLTEFSFLSIHGLLHLLGYDHMTKEDEKVMFSLQEELLDEYKITR